VFWEFCPEDVDKVIAKQNDIQKKRGEEPERFGKYLFPSQHTGRCKGFSIVDVTQEQMNNTQVFYFPEMSLKFVPINDVSKWIEEYKKAKK
jgi:hypothetical protein